MPRKRKTVQNNENPVKSNWRVSFLFLIVVVIAGVVMGRLYKLQILEHDKFEARAADQYEFFEQLSANRGNIYIRDGQDNLIPVAINEDKASVVVVPKNIRDTEGVIKTLATALELDEKQVRKKVTKENDYYEIIKRKITQEQADIIKSKNMAGVDLVMESWRSYPEGQLAAQTIGFVGYKENERVGQYGIEGEFNDELEGESGYIRAERDGTGRWISLSQRILEKPENGADLVLTLDQTAQYYVESLLEESVNKYGASSGSILVMEPDTGKVLAMANYPTYNNNEFSKVEDIGVFQNNCVSSQYEPGSIFKPVTASIPLNLGLVNPNTTYQDKGYYKVDEYTIKNSDEKVYGTVSLTEFLELSLNTGAIWAMKTAGQAKFHQYLKDYGFGQKTGIELEGEVKGDIRNLGYNREVNFVTAAFGQGISVTPIQLVTAFSAIVNGGELMKPQIVEKVIYNHKDKEKEAVVDSEVIRRVIGEQSSKSMRSMLISVVENGWGKKAKVPGYLIGGKTGTAQIPAQDGNGYSDDTIHSFIGFAPAQDPKFVTLVKLDKVNAVRFAADSSALVTGKLNKFLLDHYHVFPTEEIDEKEMEKFNKLMELKEEDLKRIKEQDSDEGAEGFVPID
ncbi:MAG: hypothetical protein GF332_02920 [Candidatus Moranbacteria bacterium]|nr:hypothetical protein [Candidatus Moranbacteria bacterium]